MQNELIIKTSNMKKVYLKPTMTVVMVQHQGSILGDSNPGTYNEVSEKASYSRQGGGWDDDE